MKQRSCQWGTGPSLRGLFLRQLLLQLQVVELHLELRLPARVQKRVVRQRLGPRLLLGEVLPLSGLAIAEAVAVVVVVVLIHPLVVQLAETAGVLYWSLIHNWLGLSSSKIDVMNLVAGCFFLLCDTQENHTNYKSK